LPWSGGARGQGRLREGDGRLRVRATEAASEVRKAGAAARGFAGEAPWYRIRAREADGTIAVVERKKETAHGAWTGLGIGALAGLLFPPAIIGAALVGGVAGGLVGKVRASLSKADAEELGAALRGDEVALAVVGDAALFERIEQVLPRASRRIAKELDLTKEDLGQAMQEADQAD
jgi:uncharacterized membrane protein